MPPRGGITMKALVALSLLFSLGAGHAARAADVTWMDISADIAYSDATTACTHEATFLYEIYLAAEITAGRFTRAVLKWGSMTMPMRQIDLSPDELAGITLQQDPRGRYWLKSFPLSPRVASFILFQIGNFACGVPQPLATVTPAPLPYVFNTPGLGVEALVNGSQALSFSGARRDGQPYTATMRLFQRPDTFQP